MRFPHDKDENHSHGRSPGNGITAMPLSAGPLATEGEATAGPDDYNPYDDPSSNFGSHEIDEEPTQGEDPFVFDDVGGIVDDVSLPGHNFFR